jgi:hypothetical protein
MEEQTMRQRPASIRSPSMDVPTGADEKIRQLTDALMQAVAERDGASEDFAAFERTLLDVSNEVCRRATKKNSKR